MKIYEYEYYIFDCDGVILNSNKVKTTAFRNSLKNEPPHKVDEFVKYHKENGGVSRYKKFDHYFRTIHPTKSLQEKTQEALAKYAHEVKEALIQCDTTKGALEFLQELKKRNKRCYLITGGDQQEVIEVFKKRGLNVYFDLILGSPTEKNKHTKDVVKAEGSDGGIFFGDSKLDLEAANKNNLDFIFIRNYSEWKDGTSTCRKLAVKATNNFYDLINTPNE